MKLQTGHVYEASGSFYCRYRANEIVDGVLRRVQRSEKLCPKNDKYYSANSRAVKLLRNEFMQKVNSRETRGEHQQQDIGIVTFWETRYLPYCEDVLSLTGQARKKVSTVRGYKQIWNQHLRGHFAKMTLTQYEPHMGTQFIQSLTGTQGKNTLKHIKAVASSIFKRAVIEQRIKVNPWHDVEMPDDAVEMERTAHYTLAEAEDIISALVDRVDCQLVMALSCFLGLRPGEIAGLRWEDIDAHSLHIRRSVVRGIIGTPKTPESIASLPLIDQVRVPLNLWRQKCGDPKAGWVFENSHGKPADLKDHVRRVIRPTLKAAGLEWKSLYAGRRGAATLAVEHTGGNFAVAQALLRHKSMTTTLNVYKKAITPEAFRAGMRLLEAATTRKS